MSNVNDLNPIIKGINSRQDLSSAKKKALINIYRNVSNRLEKSPLNGDEVEIKESKSTKSNKASFLSRAKNKIAKKMSNSNIIQSVQNLFGIENNGKNKKTSEFDGNEIVNTIMSSDTLDETLTTGYFKTESEVVIQRMDRASCQSIQEAFEKAFLPNDKTQEEKESDSQNSEVSESPKAVSLKTILSSNQTTNQIIETKPSTNAKKVKEKTSETDEESIINQHIKPNTFYQFKKNIKKYEDSLKNIPKKIEDEKKEEINRCIYEKHLNPIMNKVYNKVYETLYNKESSQELESFNLDNFNTMLQKTIFNNLDNMRKEDESNPSDPLNKFKPSEQLIKNLKRQTIRVIFNKSNTLIEYLKRKEEKEIDKKYISDSIEIVFDRELGESNETLTSYEKSLQLQTFFDLLNFVKKEDVDKDKNLKNNLIRIAIKIKGYNENYFGSKANLMLDKLGVSNLDDIESYFKINPDVQTPPQSQEEVTEPPENDENLSVKESDSQEPKVDNLQTSNTSKVEKTLSNMIQKYQSSTLANKALEQLKNYSQDSNGVNFASFLNTCNNLLLEDSVSLDDKKQLTLGILRSFALNNIKPGEYNNNNFYFRNFIINMMSKNIITKEEGQKELVSFLNQFKDSGDIMNMCLILFNAIDKNVISTNDTIVEEILGEHGNEEKESMKDALLDAIYDSEHNVQEEQAISMLNGMIKIDILDQEMKKEILKEELSDLEDIQHRSQEFINQIINILKVATEQPLVES